MFEKSLIEILSDNGVLNVLFDTHGSNISTILEFNGIF